MKNPIIDAVAGDPFILRDSDMYYMVDTNEGGWTADTFDLYRSADLENWEGPIKILDLKDISWADSMAWGPCLLKKDGYYYFTFAADQMIGIAVAEKPEGPYRDILGRPLLEKNSRGIQTIEPCLFADDDGRTYLYYGQGKCYAQEIVITPESAEFIGPVVCISDEFYYQRSLRPENFDVTLYNEATDVVKVRGRYLMSWTVYDVRDTRYSVRYAWADDPLGPFIMPVGDDLDNFLLKGSGTSWGTGGSGMFTDRDGRLMIVYHRRKYPFEGYHREICLDEVQVVDELHLKVEKS